MTTKKSYKSYMTQYKIKESCKIGGPVVSYLETY